MPAAEPTESPQLTRERLAALVAAAIVLLTLPALAILILNVDAERQAKAIWFVGSALGAAVLMYLYWSRCRVLGFVPYAALAWIAATAHGVYWHEWPGWAHGVPLGIIIAALARGRRGEQPPWEVVIYLSVVALGLYAAWMIRERGRPFDVAEWFVLIASIALAGWSWAKMFRPFFELTCEPLLWVMYRVRYAGPGFGALPKAAAPSAPQVPTSGFPTTGPCLVIANHACWLDPIFLAKVLPRPTTPMMTAKFYDLPVMRRLMVMFGIIRVPEKALKKDAPEIQEAIAALDRGECVVIFPEGYLRRTEDRPLRRFGQGVWQILQARPNTPVFAAWIEGGWGSYTSYCNGAPTKNKKKDFRRPIGVGMSAATTVPPTILEDHLKTRTHLMNLVSAARKHLGLDPLPPFKLPEKAEDESESGEKDAE
jgi:1-acyl-sn-glycerol-3-phosphate acyltransferase